MEKLTDEQRRKLEELLCYAKEHRNPYLCQITKLALDLDEKGEYDKFTAVFGKDN